MRSILAIFVAACFLTPCQSFARVIAPRAPVRAAPLGAGLQTGSFGLYSPNPFLNGALPSGLSAVSLPSAETLPTVSAALSHITASPSVLPAAAAPSALALPAATLPSVRFGVRPETSKDRPSASSQLKAISEDGESAGLWTGGIPDSKANAQLRRAHWETFKFFFGSRVGLLREWVNEQTEKSKDTPGAVEDLEGMWTAWRAKAYTGKVNTTGFECADRKTVYDEAVRVYDRYMPKDAATREAFMRYLDRVHTFVSIKRPSNYRKLAFGIFFETPLMTIAERKAYIDSKLAPEQVAEVEAHRTGQQKKVLGSFKAAALKALKEVNETLPKGKKIVAVILLGSYSIGESTPKSDIDYQLVTQDGGFEAIEPFNELLDEYFTENRPAYLEGFQHTLPPSTELVRKSFVEGYQVISPDPAAVNALTVKVALPAPTGWSRVRGRMFGGLYSAWIWAWFRAADMSDWLRGALAR